VPSPLTVATVMSEPYDPKKDPRYVPFDPTRPIGPRFEQPEPEKPNPFKGPGFAT
jgi:hypothetical protein